MRFKPGEIVWICDPEHFLHANYVKIIEVFKDSYKGQIQAGAMTDINKGPIEIFKEDQLSDDLF